MLNLIFHRMSLNRDAYLKLWYPALKQLLRKEMNQRVIVPSLPQRYFGESSLLELERRYRYLNVAYPIGKGLNVVVGHSVGGVLGLFLGQYIPIEHLILVSTVVNLDLDWSKIARLVKTITLIYEEDDPSVPARMNQLLIERLKETQVVLNVHKRVSNDHSDTLTAEQIVKLAGLK